MVLALIINNLASGGTERQVCLLANELSNYHEVSVILFSARSKRELFFVDKLDDSVKLINTSKSNKISSLITLFKHFQSNQYDFCLNFNTSANLIVPNLFRLIKHKTKLVNNIRGNQALNYSGISYWRNSVDAVFTNSYQIKDRLVNEFNIDNPVHVIHNGVFIPEKNSKQPTKPAIVCVGRINRVKNQKDILLAAERLKEKIPHTFYLVGAIQDEDYYNELNMIKQNLNLNNVIFCGEEEDVTSYYEQTDLVVISSISEGFPNVLLEAISYNRPVISSKVGEVPRVIQHGVNGYLYESGNIDELTLLIQSHLEKSSRQLKSMEKHIKELKMRFSIQSKAEELIEILEDI